MTKMMIPLQFDWNLQHDSMPIFFFFVWTLLSYINENHAVSVDWIYTILLMTKCPFYLLPETVICSKLVISITEVIWYYWNWSN